MNEAKSGISERNNRDRGNIEGSSMEGEEEDLGV